MFFNKTFHLTKLCIHVKLLLISSHVLISIKACINYVNILIIHPHIIYMWVLNVEHSLDIFSLNLSP